MTDQSHDLSIAALQGWLEQRGSTYFGDLARLYATAIERVVTQRLPEEPDSVQWLLDNLDALGHRLAKKENLKPNSLSTYLSRVRSTCINYLDWQKNPMGWSPKTKVKREVTRKGKEENGRVDESTAISSPPPAPPGRPERTLQDDINEALIALSKWPKLQAYLLPGLMKAMEDQRGANEAPKE